MTGYLSLIGSALLFLCLSAFANEDPVAVKPGDGSLTDGALLIDESTAPPAKELPVAENVDLKEVVADEKAAIAVEAQDIVEPPGPVGSETASEIEPVEASPDSTATVPEAVIPATVPAAAIPATIPATTTEDQPSLKLLSSEVMPGTSARLAWEPSYSFMGISAPTAVLVVNGVHKGPTLCLASAVHGDELNGIEIVRHILYNIDPKTLSGAIIGVPIVNLQGFRRSSRYLPDRRDLNRYFPGNPNGSAASRVAHSFFDQVVRHCDMLVDLHTGSFKRTNLPQLRADLAYKNVADLAGKMGSIVVVQSRGHPGSLRRAAVEYGIPSVTLEAGEPHILDKSSVDQGVKSVQMLLHASNMAKTLSFWELRKGPVYYKSRWVRSVNGGILFSAVALGAVVKQGDVLGTVTDPITNLSTDIVSPHHGKVIGMALNQVLYPGYAAYNIGLQAPADEAAEDETSDAAEQALSEDQEDLIQDEREMPLEEKRELERASESVMETQILEDSE